jgi:hypothetical protein
MVLTLLGVRETAKLGNDLPADYTRISGFEPDIFETKL